MPQPFKRKFKDGDRYGKKKRMQEGGQADNGEKEEGDQKVWTIASLWPVKITPWRLEGQWGQSREGSQVFESSEGNGSCLTKSLHPHWPNLHALSSSPLSVFFMFVKARHYVVSDLADLGRHAYLYVQFPLCKWKLLSLVFYLTVIVLNVVAEEVFTLHVCRSLKIQTPPCRRLGKSHSRERKICPFLLRFGNTS